jgi:hypothetical protein
MALHNTNTSALLKPGGGISMSTTNNVIEISSTATAQDADLSYYYHEEWISLNGADWNSSVSGGSVSRSQVGLDTTENAVGVLTLETNNGATNYAQISMSTNQVKIGTHAIVHRFRIAVSALSDGTDTYTIYIGLGDNTGGNDFDDGIYFRYTHSVNSGRWEAVTAIGASRSASDTGVTPTTTFSVFEISINQAGTSIDFSINGSVVATKTTNIPTNTIGFVHKIVKSVGTTDTMVYEDWTDIALTRTTAR